MSKTMSPEQLSKYLSAQVAQIKSLEREVEEIQAGFTSSYMEFKAQHDETLADLTGKVLEHYAHIDAGLRGKIDQLVLLEREGLEKRRKQLRENEIPELRRAADGKLTQARQAELALEKGNPIFDKKEEKRKARLQKLKTKLASLNAEIGRRRRGLGFLFRFPAIVRLDRKRNKIIGEIEATRTEINALRIEWREMLRQAGSESEILGTQWKELNLKAARLQDELEYLDDPDQLGTLALKRAINRVLDEMTDPQDYQAGALQEEIGSMIRLNIRTDNYEEGLGTVAGLIALMRGIETGLGSFRTSVDALSREQKMHSQHLRKLSVHLPAEVMDFHTLWEPLRKKVKDDARLSRFPLEFISIVQPAIEEHLTQGAITRMFDSLEAALKKATAGWRG